MSNINRKVPIIIAASVGVFVFILMGILFGEHRVYALPEYAKRTGEACATCHVNPGGGGPRTLRGALWAAQGKPDQVPPLPNVLLAPGVTDGADLYQIACATCHGAKGEGLFGLPLANSGLADNKIRSNILKGRLKSGMPAFEGMFTTDQLDALVAYVVALGDGTAEFPPAEYPLAPPAFDCSAANAPQPCGGQ
jgi:mono/diheme cytochrome c family protein